MDRSDEYRDVERSGETDQETPRSGDILGIGSGPVPKAPGDPSTAHDPESAAKRRHRMHSGEDQGVANSDLERSPGATGVDMGSGGTGTEVSGD